MAARRRRFICRRNSRKRRRMSAAPPRLSAAHTTFCRSRAKTCLYSAGAAGAQTSATFFSPTAAALSLARSAARRPRCSRPRRRHLRSPVHNAPLSNRRRNARRRSAFLPPRFHLPPTCGACSANSERRRASQRCFKRRAASGYTRSVASGAEAAATSPCGARLFMRAICVRRSVFSLAMSRQFALIILQSYNFA